MVVWERFCMCKPEISVRNDPILFNGGCSTTNWIKFPVYLKRITAAFRRYPSFLAKAVFFFVRLQRKQLPFDWKKWEKTSSGMMSPMSVWTVKAQAFSLGRPGWTVGGNFCAFLSRTELLATNMAWKITFGFYWRFYLHH